MATVTSSSHRSSSSYRSSARYSTSSTSSTYRSEGSLGGSCDSLDPLFEPFPADGPSLFGDEESRGSSGLAPFSRHSRPSYGHTELLCSTPPGGGAVMGRRGSAGGGVRCLGDSYYISADVSQFEPHDVVVMAFNHHVVIQAQKVLDDGSVSDTFTHKSLFPEDMDPLSISGTLYADGTLVVSVRRNTALGGPEVADGPTYRSEAHL